jgi:hypothetical protein
MHAFGVHRKLRLVAATSCYMLNSPAAQVFNLTARAQPMLAAGSYCFGGKELQVQGLAYATAQSSGAHLDGRVTVSGGSLSGSWQRHPQERDSVHVSAYSASDLGALLSVHVRTQRRAAELLDKVVAIKRGCSSILQHMTSSVHMSDE